MFGFQFVFNKQEADQIKNEHHVDGLTAIVQIQSDFLLKALINYSRHTNSFSESVRIVCR